VWLIEFASLKNHELASTFVADVLGVKEAPGDSPTRPRDLPASKTTLLIFDNCEHLVSAVAQLAAFRRLG